ncbi:hypothetical protein BDP81DRAFT_452901 [Colletotrichum phormii]|uniref:FAD-binding domain-containing protein n=1 Tax=Colletotrichum phormii TaxID=359342 RepID=A0AAJ0EDC0_9PEZI|nr:uncharacterized protein BDP81DRAFT_452901 [Colletotrichum phormii]KAK1625442.1 hypothetical protein BDP81DRAFT_452901 [Colletotrichum phormii]
MDRVHKGGVVIIGAGLSGTALALALDQKSIPCRIYEARSADADVLTSGVVLTPNGCRVLDEIGVLGRIEAKSFLFEHRINQTISTRTISFHDTKNYHAYRLYRLALLQEMKRMLAEKSVPVYYDAKFEKVISDTSDVVTFQVDGKMEHAAILIGSDGIHSTLRRYLTDLIPTYTGIFCVYGHILTSSVNWPDKEFSATSCTILGKPGSLFMVPEEADGVTLMVGTQFPHPEQGREGWQTLAASPESLVTLLQRDYDQWHDTARHILDQLCSRSNRLLSWPFYTMPKLPSWSSSSGNVIIIGDAAHAMPASSGQGFNQALEDAYSLARLISVDWTPEKRPLGLETWQSWRQTKIDRVLLMTQATNLKRSAEETRQPSTTSAGAESARLDGTRWLFDIDLNGFEARLAEIGFNVT